MTHEEVRRAVEEVARASLRWEGALPDGDLSQALDSLQRLTLAVAIEDRFQICLDEEAERSITTVDALVDLVLDLVNRSPDGGS